MELAGKLYESQGKMQSVIVSTFSIRRKGGENFIEFCLRSLGRAPYCVCVYMKLNFLYVPFSNRETSCISHGMGLLSPFVSSLP